MNKVKTEDFNIGDIVQYVDKTSDAYIMCPSYSPESAILIGEIVEYHNQLMIQELTWNFKGGRYISDLIDSDRVSILAIIGRRNTNKIIKLHTI